MSRKASRKRVLDALWAVVEVTTNIEQCERYCRKYEGLTAVRALRLIAEIDGLIKSDMVEESKAGCDMTIHVVGDGGAV